MSPKLQAIALCSILALPLSQSLADNAKPNQPRVPGQKLVKKLNLEEEQKTDFLSVMKEQREKKLEIRKRHRNEIKMLHNETLQKMEPILTKDQLQNLESIFKKRHARHLHKKHHQKKQPQLGE